jgi:hypothetical protein
VTIEENITMMRQIARSKMTGLIACLMVLMLPGEPLLAALQQEKEDYVKKIKEAEIKYGLGEFDSSIRLVEQSLQASDFPQNLKKPAYELLAKNYLAKSYLEDAKSAIRKLLQLVPTYEAPADNPLFAEEVEKVRQEMGGKTALEPTVPQEKEWYENVWIWAGVAAAGVIAYLVFKPGPEDQVPPPLPGPPAMPAN